MKSIHLSWVLLATFTLQAQTLNQAGSAANPPTLPAPTPYSIVVQGANDQVWQNETYQQASDGSIVPHVHQYTELATGLNHLVNGQWVASKEEIDISPDGSSASATNGQHQVYFPGDIYNGEIKLVMPDGQTLQSQPIGLSYFDGTNSVLLAVVTNSTGAILPSGNQVIYTNAFAGLNADIIFSYTKAGMEQDIVLRESPPDPSSLNLNPATTRLQMITEFISSPQLIVTASTVPTAVGNLEDDSLSFGAMQMGVGKAFLIGANPPSVRVDKRWLTLNGRQFLIEEVPIVSIATAIDTLPPFVAKAGVGKMPFASKNLVLPPRRLVHATPKITFIAQAQPPSRGLDIDYVTMISQTNWVFQGDMTYFISGVVNLLGTNIFEGGTTLKYATNATISIAGIKCLTAPYRPVYFTGKDDDRTGEWISGSTHNPTNFYANPALNITTSGQTLSNFRIAYAQQAVSAPYCTPNGPTFYNGQIVNSQNGFSATYGEAYLRNILFANVLTNFNNLGSVTLDVQNATFCSNQLASILYPTVTLVFTNCIFVNETIYPTTATLVGGYNGFLPGYAAFGWHVSDSFINFPFQTVGAGGYYLTNGCPFRNAGTTNIDSTLLANLAKLTTYPPIVYSNVTLSAPLTFNPQVQRDDTGNPDLGYHYAPIDWFFGGVNVYSNVAFTAGTAAGWFDLPSFNGAPGYGISLHGQVIAAFNGTATAPCIWARYETVQEGGNGLWVAKDYVGGIESYQGNSYTISIAPQIVANFTHFAEMYGDPNHFRDYYTPLIAIANNCEFYSGSVGAYNNSCFWTNCLVCRMTAAQDQGYNPSNAFVMRNCTWKGGLVYFTPNNNPITLSVRDCAFDGTAFTISSYGSGTNTDYDYNAYTNGSAELPATGNNNITNIVGYNWQTSWLGSYYLSPGSPLIDRGDVTANTVGLYHFTTQTNQTPEYNSTVDIGYHYVAVDPNNGDSLYGQPLDYNNDGIPDYLEDANGNGLVDSGEIAWDVAGDLGLKVVITRPRNGSILP
ncbi:MAG TPA: hypothetical protein VMJ12_15645 [Candidatus Acidoferrales bacterium]|nr:hypothetical protein [Candidatus Acidoferrales bacterium]